MPHTPLTGLQSLEPRLLLTAVTQIAIEDLLIRPGGSAVELDLNINFDDDAIDGTVVEFDTVLGDYRVELFDSITSQTVQNFLNYVNDGDYDGSFIHRSVPGFVVQGGGFTFEDGVGVDSVPTDSPVVNEFENHAFTSGDSGVAVQGNHVVALNAGADLSNVVAGDRIRIQGRTDGLDGTEFFEIASADDNADTITLVTAPADASAAFTDWFITHDVNVRGTIAMAKLGGDPDSATSQWFVNLGNNASNLDTQNGGFTAFGRVLGNGMDVVDAIAAADRVNAGGAFATLPVQDDTAPLDEANLIMMPNGIFVVSELEYSIEGNTNAALVAVSVDAQGNLTVTPQGNGTGSADITIRATAVDGSTVDQVLTVNVEAINPVLDMDNDGDNDLVWRNLQSGKHTIWKLNDDAFDSSQSIKRLNRTEFVLAGVGDFNNDGSPDLFFRNLNNGVNTVWFFDNGVFQGSQRLNPVGNLDFEVGALGDFDGDGDVDIAWRNTADHRTVIWELDGTTLEGASQISFNNTADWRVQGSGDFNRDGTDDLVFRNVSNGNNALAFIRDNAFQDSQGIRRVGNTDFHVGAVADFNGDGHVDIFWRDPSTGRQSFHFYDAATYNTNGGFKRLSNTDWQLPGATSYVALANQQQPASLMAIFTLMDDEEENDLLASVRG